MFHKVKNAKLYEEVIRQIKQMISQGQIKKGEKLPTEKELTEMIGVSRVTVREALRILGEMGIVETFRGSGSYVKIDVTEEAIENKFLSTMGEFRDNFKYSAKIKLMLEPEIAKAAANKATAEDIGKLSRILDRTLNTGLDENDRDNPLEEFHMAIVDILENPVLRKMYMELESIENTQLKIRMTTPDQKYEIKRELFQQHRKIYEAIKNHKGEFAYFYMKEHIEYVLNTYENYFEHFFLD